MALDGNEGCTTMTLTLRAVSLNDIPLTQPITAHFDAEGGSVGRADHNTLALPDPERHISRQHAEISVGGDGYRIKNVGSANPIILRGQALVRGESAPLAHRDQVRIGGYLLEVIHEDADDAEAGTIVRGRAAVDARTPAVARQTASPLRGVLAPRTTPAGGSSHAMGDPGPPLSSTNPFADLLGDPAPTPASAARQADHAMPPAARGVRGSPKPQVDPFDTPQPPAAGVCASSAAWAPAQGLPGRALLPDDFDVFAQPMPAPATSPQVSAASAASAGGGAFDDLIPSAAPASIDQWFGLQRSDRDPLADFMADLAPARAAGWDPQSDSRSDHGSAHGSDHGSGQGSVKAPLSTDPMALFGAAPANPMPYDGLPTPADNVPELRAAFVPPALRPRPAASPTVAPPDAVSNPMRAAHLQGEPARAAGSKVRPVAEAAPVATPQDDWRGDPAELWRAFCEGAGVALAQPQGVNPELMRVVGGLLRAAVAGTLQLMTVRAATKHELRAQVTMIQARNNNPLKFSPDARSALEQLLQPPMRGFLAGPAAMTDAMHDMMGHTIGTMAGTRAALEGVLDRFTPQQLEAKLVGKSMLDSLLPMNRKAKLWELYLSHFDAIRNEAHDDFHTLFGKAFLAAYEQQLDRLQRDEPRQV